MIHLFGVFTRDGSRFSNIQFNDRISIRLCDYFLKVYPHWVFWTIPEPRLSPKALFVWVKWSLGDALGRGLFSRPWLGCKRWARVRFIWTLARHTYSVSSNRAGARNFWYVHPDCVNNRSVKPIHRERAVCFSIKKQLKIINHKVNKTMHSPALSESASLPPSRAIGNIRFPTYEVVTSSLHSIFLLNK